MLLISNNNLANLLFFFCNLGGHYLPVGDERCTHLVVEESTVKDLPFEPLKKLYVVKQEVSADKFLEFLYNTCYVRNFSFSE